jgi:hypothetical protein
LQATLQEADAAVIQGRVISSSSGNGKSIGFSILSDFSPVAARRLAGELCDLYDSAKAALAGTPEDAAIYAGMMASLVIIRDHGNDFSEMRRSYAAI